MSVDMTEQFETLLDMRPPSESVRTHSRSVYPSEDDGLDSLTIYLNEVGSYPLLTHQEEIELASQIEQGNEKAREKLIQCNLRLVVSIAKAYVCSTFPLLDAIQEGNIGLIKSVDKYDYRRGTRFSTHTVWWIRAEMSRASREKRNLIRIPPNTITEINQLERAIEAYWTLYKQVPSIDFLAKELHYSRQNVVILLSQKTVLSLDLPHQEDTDHDSLPEAQIKDETVDIEEEVTNYQDVYDLLSHLDNKSRLLLELRYGLIDGEERNNAEIGRLTRFSRERVRQLLDKALYEVRLQVNELSVEEVADLLIN